MIYQIRMDVYCKSKEDAEAFYSAIEKLKDKFESFTDASTNLQTSTLDLIENNHDGKEFQPCVKIKETILKEDGSFLEYNKETDA